MPWASRIPSITTCWDAGSTSGCSWTSDPFSRWAGRDHWSRPAFFFACAGTLITAMPGALTADRRERCVGLPLPPSASLGSRGGLHSALEPDDGNHGDPANSLPNPMSAVRLLRLALMPALAALWLDAAPAATPSATTRCDRHCLEGLIDTYLAALAAHDPTRAPLARDVRSTENGATVAMGEGLWRTAGRATDYRIYIADVPAGQAGFVGTILQTDGKPLMLALRLKVADGAIHEIEAITGAPFELPGSP